MEAKVNLKTRDEARQELRWKGISIAGFARKHGVSPDQVRDVLRKDTPCNFGASHKIAVLLGIKDGVIDEG